MNDKQFRNDDTKPWKEELEQEDRLRQPSPEKTQQASNERSPEEEADAEQQYKEAMTERD